MTKEELEYKIRRRYGRRNHEGRIWSGLFFIALGALFIAREAGVGFPQWFFTWPTLLIGIGVFLFVKHGFRHFAPLVMIGIGVVFLVDQYQMNFSLKPFLWPAMFVVFGFYLVVRPRRRFRHWKHGDPAQEALAAEPMDEATVLNTTEDVIDITTMFGGVKKKVLSKNFRGGDIVSVMGGSEIDLRQADFKDRISIDNFTLFGGTKLIVPAEWDVQSEVVAIFGGVDDKRPLPSDNLPRKILHLEGTCIFGGIEIKHF